MLQFDIITIFPKMFDSYFFESIILRAQKKKLIKINVHDLRKWTTDKRKTIDDKAYGGGPGMVLKVEPLAKALWSILKIKNQSPIQSGTKIKNKVKIILFSASGKQFTNSMAASLAEKYERIIMICGHYEGVDERIKRIIENYKLKIENLSIGPYVLTGGELPAMVLVDSVTRQIPGVLGKVESLEEKRLGVGVPVYTRPEIFVWKGKKYLVPKVLLSGNHKKIEDWRLKQIKKISYKFSSLNRRN